MTTDVHQEQTPGVTNLVAGIVGDTQDLLRQEFQLLKHEALAEVHKVKLGAQVLMFGAGLAVVGILLLGFALAYWLATAMPDVPLWGCFALAGGGLVVLGGAVYGGGWSYMHQPLDTGNKDVFGLPKR